jgi:(p)ppGpp synthase/HD superfamily hydrolase
MLLTAKIEKAIVRSAELHRHQERKAGGAPYIVHPFAVAFLLAHYSEDEDVICAGLLHDILEDVPSYGVERMRAEFGERVCAIVREVTEDNATQDQIQFFPYGNPRKKQWKERKEGYLKRLEDDSPEGLMIAAADKIHNLRSLVSAYVERGEALWKTFPAGKQETAWFYQSVLAVLERRLPHPLVDELRGVLQEAEEKIFTR